MRINFSADFLNSGATSLKAGCRERNVFETRRDNANGTITIVRGEHRWNNRELPRVIDCSIWLWCVSRLLRGNTGEETTMRQREWQRPTCVPRIIRNGPSERNEETGARIENRWKIVCLADATKSGKLNVERNFDHARLTI